MENIQQSSRPFSQSDAMKDILSWSDDRPNWQCEALTRIVANGSLHSNDLDQLERLCLKQNDIHEKTKKPEMELEKIANEPVSLISVQNPVGINALVPDQTLLLAESGLSIVYGDNGSGKSGYVRILKHACRSRDKKFEILPDVNGATNVLQSATLNFKVGKLTHSFSWTPDQNGDPRLPSVSIFDSRSANTHVEATNNVAYIPFPMQVLEKLASACDEMKRRIDSQIVRIQEQTPHSIRSPNLSPETPAGAFVTQLSEKSNIETLDLLVQLTDEDKRRFASLNTDLAQDPRVAVAKLNAIRSRLEMQLLELSNLVKLASEATFNRLRELQRNADHTARVSNAASEKLFSASPLPDIGGEQWKSLWESARQYSDLVAYPEKSFPEGMIENDLCVLCQQPLDKASIARQQSFEEFIKSTAKKEESDAKLTYENALQYLVKNNPGLSLARSLTTLIRDELDDAALAGEIRRIALIALWRLRFFEKGQVASSNANNIPTDQLNKHIQDLNLRINQLSVDDTSEERKILVAEQSSLKDRYLLSELKFDVVAEIDRRKNIATLKKALKTTAKRSVTDKNKELSDKLVTDALRGRFAREVEKLKIGTMPIELRKVRDRNAQSYFCVDFVGLPGKPIGEVLSEGEHRCVALAAFLAELVTTKDYSGIVFDDPMSSLDHLYRKNVAKRLVEESAHRQVVVFTHDLGFLFELAREADTQDIDVHYQNVRRKQKKPGYVVNEQPMKAKAAGQLANALQVELKAIKASYDNLSDAKRIIFAKGIIEQLREAWDQGIADFVYPVLGRFDSQIKGSSLFKLAVLTNQDILIVTQARSRLSEDLHASPETLNPAEASHSELSAEVKKLIDWASNIKNRQNSASKPKISFV